MDLDEPIRWGSKIIGLCAPLRRGVIEDRPTAKIAARSMSLEPTSALDPETVVRHAPGPDDFLSPAQLAALTPQKVIAATQALKPRLAGMAREAEAQRRPIDALWDELRRSGYFYLLVPKKYGGLEADIDDVIDASLPIAEGCGSTGWVAMFALVHNRHMVGYPDEVLEELFGGGRYFIEASATIPPGKAVAVEGGYRVSGRWQWCTCITQADWVQVTVNVDTQKGPRLNALLIPAREVQIVDTWDVDGMCATGSHDIVCEDVFVPARRAMPPPRRDVAGAEVRFDHPIYRVPLSPLLAFTTAVPTLGVARAAVDAYRERLMTHTKRGTEGAQREKQAAQIRLARANTMVTAAELLIRNAIKKNLEAVQSGDGRVGFRSALRAQLSYAAQLSREAVLVVTEASGSSIHFLSNPMQRYLRDIMVMTSHIIFDHDVTMEQHGRSMLGLDPTSVIV
jgi:alkylation response protein AidB-like acyl-CoA dehydrogenase